MIGIARLIGIASLIGIVSLIGIASLIGIVSLIGIASLIGVASLIGIARLIGVRAKVIQDMHVMHLHTLVSVPLAFIGGHPGHMHVEEGCSKPNGTLGG